MRQVLKDRLDRIDMEISYQQFRYREQFAKEQATGRSPLIGGTKAIEAQVQRLLKKKEALMDGYLNQKIGTDKYINGLRDRQNQYDFALEEQKEFERQLLEQLAEDPTQLEQIKHLRGKIAGLNRLIVIYKKTLDMWIKKSSQIRDKGEVPLRYKQINTKTNEEIGDEGSTKLTITEADPQILAILNKPKNADGSYQAPITESSLETLTQFESLREINAEALTPEEYVERKRVCID